MYFNAAIGLIRTGDREPEYSLLRLSFVCAVNNPKEMTVGATCGATCGRGFSIKRRTSLNMTLTSACAGNESVPKIIINDTLFLLNCNQHFGNFKH